MESSQEGLAELKANAVEMIKAYFHETGRGLLLSRLGQGLRARGIDVPSVLMGRKLAEFLREELADSVSIVVSPLDPKIFTALPKGAVEKPVTSTLPSKALAEAPTLPRIAPAFWAAFIHPLAAGKKRIVRLDPPSFEDVDESQDTSKNQLIEESFLRPHRADNSRVDHNKEVFESLSRWLQENDVSLERVTSRAVARKPVRPNTSLLDQVIAKLTDEQLKRISMPLDVVAELSRI